MEETGLKCMRQRERETETDRQTDNWGGGGGGERETERTKCLTWCGIHCFCVLVRFL